MKYTSEEIRDYIMKKIDASEGIGIHELQELAEKSNNLDFIQVNNLYANLLESMNKEA